MKRAVLWILALAILGGLSWAAYRLWDERQFAGTPFGEGTHVVQLTPGSGPRTIAQQLGQAGVVSDAARFLVHLRYFRRGQVPKAGEYEFIGPLTPDEVLQKLVRGEVKLYRFTVPEGLRADEIAQIVGATGLCDAGEFLKQARDETVARALGVPATSLEGFLFPDTYSVTRASGCRGIAQAMVARFRAAWEQADAQRLPSVKLNQLQAVTLASIIEKETGQPDERPRISCVFHNRLKKGWRLGTDPTVIYSILLRNDFHWDGKIHKSDLERPHPYNTYVSYGLPPGPIASPGQAALAAALHPLECSDFYFVSKNDHTHVFCPDAACHEKNVQKWQIDFFKKKRAASGGG
jgi:UPF0755 protein